MTYLFDADTEVVRRDDGSFAAELSDRWSVGDKPNGGYLLAVALRAISDELAHPDPLTVTAHYLRAPVPGPVDIEVEKVREGRTLSTATARMIQGDRDVMRVIAGFRDVAAADGSTRYLAQAPDLPPVEPCVPGSSRGPGGIYVSVADRFEYRIDPATIGWAIGRPSGDAAIRGYVRFADGREMDTLALPLLVDAMPPPVFDLGTAGWVPTLELTVHVRGNPAPGWLRMFVTTRFITDGDLEEDVEVWDSQGALVAQARQLARLTSPLPDNG